jgi:hypothetical protein
MIDEVLVRLSRLAASDPDRTVEDLRRLYEHGRASGPETTRFEDVLRRLDEHGRRLEDDRVERERALAGLPPVVGSPSSRGEQATTGETALLEQLGEARELLLRHPSAARALAHAVMRAGRAFAATDEGRRWAERLCTSPIIERAHLAWDQLTLGLVGDLDDGDALDLDQLLDALLNVAERPDRDALLRHGARKEAR